MSAGTLKLTNNSTAVVGTSTLFTTDLKPGDFITATIGGVLYTLPVDTVTSNTAATLVSPFTGPTTTGAAWAAVPRKALNQVTADLVAQTTAAMRGMNNDKANWQSFYSAAGDINITLPDGTKVPGPSWTKMAGLVSSSQQWRGNLPAAANLNAYGPTPDFTGTWNRSSNTNTTAAYGFPEDNGQGILEVFAGGRYGGLQRYTVSVSGNVYIRSLTGAWNGTDGPWSDWLPAGIQTRMSFFTGDLNTLKTPGEWSVTTPFTSGPTDIPGICEVIPRLNGTGLLQRYTAIATGAAGINRTWQRTLSGTTWSGWDPVGIKPLNDLGMGWSAITTLSSFDWQQFDALSGQICRVAIENMANLPPGITFTNGTGVYVLVNGTSSGGTRFSLEIIPDTATDSNYKIYKVLVVGAKGARTFSVRQVFTNTDVVPVANGGTGAATPAGARTALQLGDSATKNVGSTAGTVAAGDDYRIKDAASVKGAGFTGVIDFLNYTTSGDPGEAIILRAAHGVSNPGEFYNNFWKAFAPDGSFSRMQHYTTSYHSIRMVIAGATGGTGVFTFGQTGNAIASGSWVNSGCDERIKYGITPIESPRDILMNIRAATWKYRHKGAEGRFGIGVIANDIGKYFPDAVINTGSRELDDGTVVDDVLAVEAGDSGAMVAVHHAVLQSLVEENRSQQLEIEALKSDMEELKKMVERLITK
ncbi:MAG: pyocin knob domain-containing S74 family peptidase [Atlantibacter hermannii]|uniref:pyocin knob domain-containing S74 family peptidase n=1 Tax=Atlantibacter hermannii TaxID=565 RepID=UPI0029154093|nr:pyocin knob domain-containing S74 family peptidase [Atlantibacter hermannii]MDU7814784.1 pyocin knob domain-containing S74 family peptidase [Atlantibacter hermannii]